MTDLRETAQQMLKAWDDDENGTTDHPLSYTIEALRAALAQQEQEPVAWTDRELELIDGMIEVQLRHAAQCDDIANRPMAERQKGWDMERVALLRKIKSRPPRREWRGLTMQEINALPEIGGVMWRMGTAPAVLRAIRAVERALKEKNNG